MQRIEYMAKTEYDIFISYRRKGGKNYARTLKPELEKRGYRVFLDFDELKDGVFDKRIMDAISDAPIFMVILSEGALDRCSNDGDWVREEILYADKMGRHIVPVEVDKTFREFPENLPKEVKIVLGPHQFSQIDTETLLQESIDKMVRERVKPYVQHSHDILIPKEIESKEGAEIHIEVDADSRLFRFKKLLKELHSNDDNIVYLMPGKHKLEFVSSEYPEIKEIRVIEIPYKDYSDLIEISLMPRIEVKRKEEIKRKEEEEAKRRAAEKKLKEEEEAKLKAEKEAELIAEALDYYNKGKELYDKELYDEALEWLEVSAEQGNADAQGKLGDMFYCGLGVAENKEEAAKWYYKAAEQGDPDAQCSLGIMYRNGECFAQSDEEALKWFSKAAEKGNANAQFFLGNMYREGQGIDQNLEEAIKWYHKAAEQGDSDSQYNLGYIFENGEGVEQNYEKAAKWYHKAAEQGDANAQYSLGLLYKNGQGVTKNYEEAIKWFLKSVDNYEDSCDACQAQREIGFMYENGLGVTQNYEEAIRWYCEALWYDEDAGKALDGLEEKMEKEKRQKKEAEASSYLSIGFDCLKKESYDEALKWFLKAANLGNSDAQTNLGVMHAVGQGVNQNSAEAVKWYCKAAEQGNDKAQFHLGNLYRKGQGVKLNYSEAKKWYKKAAEQDNVDAQNGLGELFVMDSNYSEALEWFRKAAEQGNAYGQTNLGWMYEYGKGVNEDYAEAIKWYRMAAEQGNAHGQIYLGKMYDKGKGVQQDSSEAVKLFRKAAEQNDPWAQRLLGYCFKNGKGIKQDNEQAKSWFEKAAAQGDETAKQALDGIYEEGRVACYVIKDGDKYGYADQYKKSFIPCIWTKAEEFIEGVGLVWDGKNMGAINKKGDYYFPCKVKCKEAKYLGNNLIKVTLDSNSGYEIYNLKGEQPEYQFYTGFYRI